MSNYSVGAAYERKVRKEIEAEGYLCIKAGGSKGFQAKGKELGVADADLLCIKIQQPTLCNPNITPKIIAVQVKKSDEKVDDQGIKNFKLLTGVSFIVRRKPKKKKSVWLDKKGKSLRKEQKEKHKYFKRKKAGLIK